MKSSTWTFTTTHQLSLNSLHVGNRLRTQVADKRSVILLWSTIDSAHSMTQPRPDVRASNLAFLTHAIQGRGEKYKDPAWGACRVQDLTSQSCTPFCGKLRSEG